MIEVFKDVPNYEGIYQVSNFGNVKSFKCGKEKQKKSTVNSSGYLNICLTDNEKKQRTIKVHVLVAMTFLNYKPNGKQDFVIDHKNEIKTDNRVENLQIISQRENIQKHHKNKNGGLGCVFHPQTKKWRSRIHINGFNIHLGLFEEKKTCEKIFIKASKNIHLFNGDKKEFKNKINKL